MRLTILLLGLTLVSAFPSITQPKKQDIAPAPSENSDETQSVSTFTDYVTPSTSTFQPDNGEDQNITQSTESDGIMCKTTSPPTVEVRKRSVGEPGTEYVTIAIPPDLQPPQQRQNSDVTTESEESGESGGSEGSGEESGGSDGNGESEGSDGNGESGGSEETTEPEETGESGGTEGSGESGGSDVNGGSGGSDGNGESEGSDANGESGGSEETTEPEETGESGGTEGSGESGGSDANGESEGSDGNGESGGTEETTEPEETGESGGSGDTSSGDSSEDETEPSNGSEEEESSSHAISNRSISDIANTIDDNNSSYVAAQHSINNNDEVLDYKETFKIINSKSYIKHSMKTGHSSILSDWITNIQPIKYDLFAYNSNNGDSLVGDQSDSKDYKNELSVEKTVVLKKIVFGGFGKNDFQNTELVVDDK